jgi:hypothetical protein
MYRPIALALAMILSGCVLSACRGTRSGDTTTPPATASTPARDGSAFTGTVAETMKSGGYTYARLQSGKDDVWIAASEFETHVGDRLTVALETPMHDFQSKTLGRTFPLIYFVPRVGREGEQPGSASTSASPALMSSHAGATAATKVEPMAPAPGGVSIADLWARRAALSGQAVTVRGKVVKVSEQIMGRNWIHLQDGTGSAADRTNDLTITTVDSVKNGDVVVVKGVLAVDKDFGAGYAYGAILENAKVVR